MKKVFKSLMLLFVVVALTGCGQEKEVVKTCKLSQNQLSYKLESTYTIYGKGKTVDKVETVETVLTDNSEILDYFEELLNTTYEATDETYGGYTINVTKDSDKVVSKVSIDYNKMNLKKYVEDNTAIKSYVTSDNKILIEGIQSIYEQLGAICE